MTRFPLLTRFPLRGHLFTFLEKPAVPFDNKHAEQQIRPAVIMCKNIQGNRSADGANTQALLMSIFRTLKLRGHDATQTINAELRELLQTGKLPPLPAKADAGGEVLQLVYRFVLLREARCLTRSA